MESVKAQLKKIPFIFQSINSYKYYKRKVLYKSILKETKLSIRPTQKVLIYPDSLSWSNAIRSILEILNFEITQNIDADYLFAIKWHDCTFKQDEEWLDRIKCKGPILNLKSLDISKKYVDGLCQEVFGYSTIVDPSQYQGKCVKKSNINSRHDGTIISCPIAEEIHPDYIYQILINNVFEEKYLEEFRVPFYKDHIPFVFEKYKSLNNQFISNNKKVLIKKPEDLFSKEEIEMLIKLPQKMGLDFAEMDVLRNRDSGLLYVIDVNDTPGAIPRNIGKLKREALLKMTLAFYNSFIKNLS